MGKVLSLVSRKANRFNAENRVHRFLDQEKLPPAPKYESSYEDMQRTLTNDPEFLERSSRRDIALDNRLKQVFVTSENKIVGGNIDRIDENKSLPLDRTTVEDYEYGFKEPVKVTLGRCTLRQAMKFIADFQTDPEMCNSDKISNDYKLKRDVVDKILMYYKTFEIYIPDKNLQESILQQPKVKFIESKKNDT